MDLYIIGAGDVGGFIAYHAQDMGEFLLKGFLDDDVSKHGKFYYGLPVIGSIADILELNDPIAVAMAIASPLAKQKIAARLKTNKQIQFPSFIHSSVWLGRDTKIQDGCIIYPGVTINYESDVYEFSTINMNVAIGHNCTLGACTTISPGVNLGGGTRIGNCSFVGIGASTVQGVKIGEEVTVGGMTIVLKDVPDGATVVGNPGKIIKGSESSKNIS